MSGTRTTLGSQMTMPAMAPVIAPTTIGNQAQDVPLPLVRSAYRSGEALRKTARMSMTEPSSTSPVRKAPMIAPTKAPATTARRREVVANGRAAR